jgi:23S rRNA (cytidine1920-2'-O)/16S rRNA (cytidine1409-2'-O)-methyltransferase
LAGRTLVDGYVLTKAGSQVSTSAELDLSEPDHPYVGRGGIKLAHALKNFEVAVSGRIAIDIGASIGGFTDALLQHGAAHVIAVDVGYGQLDWQLRNNPRVLVIERLNARHLTTDALPSEFQQVDIVTIDVAFISVKQILPVIPSLLNPNADVIVLVKPQFEAERAEVGKGGIVRDPVVHAKTVNEVVAFADRIGLHYTAGVPSPITGSRGNREFLVHLRSDINS